MKQLIKKICAFVQLKPVAKALIAGLISTLIAGITVWGLSYFAVGKGRVEAEARALKLLEQVRIQLDRELDSMLTIPETMAMFIAASPNIAASPDISHGDMDGVAEEILLKHPEIISIVLAPNSEIRRAYPLQGNETIIGLRYLEVPEQAEAVLRAIASRRTVVAGPFELRQGGLGISSRTPIFLRHTLNGEAKSDDYWGIVSLTLDAQWLLSRVGLQEQRDAFELAVRGVDGLGVDGPTFGGKHEVFARQPVTISFVLPGGGVWVIAAAPKDGWPGMRSGTSVIVAMAYVLASIIGLLTYRLMLKHQLAVRLATHDQLTGLPNRILFVEALTQALNRAVRYRHYGVLLMLDLDKFKPVNDIYGHHAGDMVLQMVGTRLHELIRAGDMAARLGGDEFAVMLCGGFNRTALTHFCERVIASLNQPVHLDEKRSVSVGVCIGAVAFTDEEMTVTMLIERADKALYVSKHTGTCCYTIDMGNTDETPPALDDMDRKPPKFVEI